MTNEAGLGYDLADVIQQRRWQVSTQPFAHVVAHDVFAPEFYGMLDSAYGEVLDRGLSEEDEPHRFSRNIRNYDAYSTVFSEEMPEPLQVFLSKEWHDMLASLAGINATRDVNGAFHHHSRGSRSGQVHNDLNPGWFPDSTDPERVNHSRHDLCSYSTGEVRDGEVTVHETVRALAVLFFMHNGPWRQGMGGETGLYANRRQAVMSPTKIIPPIDNSIFIFECTPYSFHSFLSNLDSPRNSMIMWLHRTKEEAVERWGDDAIVYWGGRPRNQPL